MEGPLLLVQQRWLRRGRLKGSGVGYKTRERTTKDQNVPCKLLYRGKTITLQSIKTRVKATWLLKSRIRQNVLSRGNACSQVAHINVKV